MVLPADPHLIYSEEQGRLRACVYAFGRSFTETYKAWNFHVADRPEKHASLQRLEAHRL